MDKDTRTIYLVDGTSYIYRAYHAIRNLSNSKGFPTNAILGFTKMVLKLLGEKKPEYLAVVFDAKGPTFRHELYKKYKANRPPMPEDMSAQIGIIKEIVENLGLKMVEKPGFEADDIIGTLAREAELGGFKVVMVTGDKDFRQLITSQTCMWDTMKDSVTDYDILKETYGFEPVKFIDIMGLSGDTSDNIPGVPGVGEKTAIGLIRDFGSFENVFDRLEDITKKKLKENLQKSHAIALLSKKLVTIDRFVPLDEKIEQFKVEKPKEGALSDTFREYEFRGLLNQFSSRKKEDTDYKLILKNESLLALIEKIKKERLVSIDTETTSPDPLKADLVGISFSLEEGKAYYLPLDHNYLGAPTQIDKKEALETLKEILEDKSIAKVGQNIKYDAEVFRLEGVKVEGIHFDTMIASYVINPGLRQHNLDYLAQHYLNHKMISYKEVVGGGKNVRNFSEVEIEAAKNYSCEDADITLRLMSILEKNLLRDKNEKLFYDLEMNLIPVLIDMELTGIRINTEFFGEMSSRLGKQMKEIEEEIFREAGMQFNINSPQQLGHVLFEKLQLPVQRKTTKTKNYSTDVRVLKKLTAYPHKTPKLVLRYRTLTKLKSTYLDSLVKTVDPSTGRIHTSFNQTVAATGRLSSSNPNLQNIPIRGEEGREIRKGFVAEPGHYLLSADYSQVELRVLAHYSEDKAFLEAFEKNEDIHTRTASEILSVERQAVTAEMRRIAKVINFGIIYGMGPQKLSEELSIDKKTAKTYINTYYERYTGFVNFRDEMIQSARENGYVKTLFNRRRYLPDIQHNNRLIRGEAERMALNTPIQGTAADLIKKAMINIYHRLKVDRSKTKMLLQVHDELIFEVPEEEIDAIIPMIREEMEGVYKLKVPLKVDIHKGRNWDEAH